jgi:K+ transporter
MPRVPAQHRVRIEPVGRSVLRVKQRFGYMEAPNVPGALAIAPSFFLSRPACAVRHAPAGTQVAI